MHIIVWEFIAKGGFEEKFEKAYGPEGDWVKLFREGEGYIRTELHRDTGSRSRYLTIDYWKSKTSYDTFRSSHVREYQLIDERCSTLTTFEALIGAFSRSG